MNLNVNLIRLLAVLLLLTSLLWGQESKVKWQRSAPATQPDLQLFHSPHGIDLPTATTLQKWDMEFEISHRFIPTTSSGIEGFYGLDGPVNMRLALGLALSNRMLVTLGRSNYNDNYDLDLKYKFLQIRHERIPTLLAMRIGGAWNTDPQYREIAERAKSDIHNFQFFGQLIINSRIGKKLTIGLVPSYLYNTDIRWGPETDDSEVKDILRLGTHFQFYVSPLWSVLVEWSPYLAGYKSLPGQENNPLSYGIELETGGHFFKIFLTNSQYLNSSQYLAGADIPVENNDWRFGFMITRLLKFSKKM
jgi:hypothetical protein